VVDPRHLAGVLLHTPSVRAKEVALDGRGQEFVDALRTIYGISSTLGSPETGETAASA